jgi:hypothetical protein
MVRQITGNRNIAFVAHLKACAFQPIDHVKIAVRLRIVFIARIKRTAPQRYTKHTIDAPGIGLHSKSKARHGPGRNKRGRSEKIASLHLGSLQSCQTPREHL